MKVKIIGFKVDKIRATYNLTIDLNKLHMAELGQIICTALECSDFLSIWLEKDFP